MPEREAHPPAIAPPTASDRTPLTALASNPPPTPGEMTTPATIPPPNDTDQRHQSTPPTTANDTAPGGRPPAGRGAPRAGDPSRAEIHHHNGTGGPGARKSTTTTARRGPSAPDGTHHNGTAPRAWELRRLRYTSAYFALALRAGEIVGIHGPIAPSYARGTLLAEPALILRLTYRHPSPAELSAEWKAPSVQVHGPMPQAPRNPRSKRPRSNAQDLDANQPKAQAPSTESPIGSVPIGAGTHHDGTAQGLDTIARHE